MRRVTAEAVRDISAAPDPLYHQVYSIIADAISSGQLKPGNRLPTERSLCQRFGVSRATVRKALRRLADEGVVTATVGRGSFVVGSPLAEPPNALMSFTELAAVRGLTASAEVARQQLRPATVEEASVFGIDVTGLIFELERVRVLEDDRVAVDRTRIPVAIAPGLTEQDFTDASIYETLDDAGAAPVRGDVVVSSTAADEQRAAALGIPVGAPLLVCTTMSHDEVGRLVEICEIAYRADRYQFRATLTRPTARPVD
ncbi:MAG TPA: GntR family transcriptional regulator [Gaiellaceae bacterium]